MKREHECMQLLNHYNERYSCMKTPTATAVFFLMHCLICCAVTSQALAADKQQSPGTLATMKQEAGQDFKAIENYSAARKDEAINKTQAALADLDARIEGMENRSAAKWHSMGETARKKQQAALRELKRERIKVAEWYGSMKNSSAEAWEDTKKAFLKSTEALSDAFNKAEQQMKPKKNSN
jgi:hypothetical protein